MPSGVYKKTEEHRRILSKAAIKRWKDPKQREEQSKLHEGKKHGPMSEERKRNIGNGNRGKVRSKEVIKKNSKSHLGLYKDPKERKKLSKPRTEKAKANMKGKCGIYIRTEEHKKNLSKNNARYFLGKHFSDEHRKNISKSLTRVFQDPKERKKQSERITMIWQNPEYQKIMAKARNLKPNNLEQFFDEQTPDIVKYVGDFSLWIVTNKGTWNPDFVIEGQNKIIELFGNYWHKDDDPDKKIREYAKAGWKCIVFWENEVHNESERVQKETLEFIEMN